MTSVLVTGHSGFIGRHLDGRLRSAGIEVTGLSRSNGFDLLKDDLPTAGIHHLYHLAALTFVPDSWRDPTAFFETNALGTVRVLDQCRRAHISVTFVSAYVYGTPSRLPVSENHPTRPSNPYAFSKIAAESACQFYAESFGVRTSIMRVFNVYGPGQSGSFLIPTIARQVLDADVEEVVVADLAPRRDFVHVDDVVDALLLAPGLDPGTTLNVGSGMSESVADVIEACMSAAGVRKPFRDRGERREHELMEVVADISAIQRICGWTPKTSFQSGIRSVVESMGK